MSKNAISVIKKDGNIRASGLYQTRSGSKQSEKLSETLTELLRVVIDIYVKTINTKSVDMTPYRLALNKVRVVVESNGELVTAFPQGVFKEMKIADFLVLTR